MKKVIVSLILVLIFSMVGTGLALADTQVQEAVNQPTEITVIGDTYQETDPIAEAGVTPDSWFYTFEKWVESLQVLMTFSPEGKAELLASLANERLAESRVLENKEMYELVGETLQDYVETVTAANLSAQAAVSAGKDISEVINQISSVETQALSIVATVADKLPPKIQKSLVKAMAMQEEKLAKVEEKLAQKEAQVDEIQKALEIARKSGDLAKVAELEKKLAEAQLAFAEAKEAAVRKLGQNQIKMVRTQLNILNRLGRATVSEDVYEKEEKDVADDIYQDPAKLVRKEAFKQAKEVRKEAFNKAKEVRKETFEKTKEVKKEAVKKALEVKKEARQLDGQEARREALKAAEEAKKEALKATQEVKKEALKATQEAKEEAIKEAKGVKKEAIEKAREAGEEARQTQEQEDKGSDKEEKSRR